MAAAVNVSKSSRIDKVKPLLSVTLPLLTLRVFGDGENQHDKRRSQKRVRAERVKKPLLKKTHTQAVGPSQEVQVLLLTGQVNLKTTGYRHHNVRSWGNVKQQQTWTD